MMCTRVHIRVKNCFLVQEKHAKKRKWQRGINDSMTKNSCTSTRVYLGKFRHGASEVHAAARVAVVNSVAASATL